MIALKIIVQMKNENSFCLTFELRIKVMKNQNASVNTPKLSYILVSDKTYKKRNPIQI